MTTEQYWKQLDTLASAKGTDRLLEAAELLRANPSLPLLISCRHVHGRIRHLFTSFDERNPDATGNRYLICFTSTKQAERTPSPPTVDDAHEAGPSFDNLDERYASGGRRAYRSLEPWKPGRPLSFVRAKSLPMCTAATLLEGWFSILGMRGTASPLRSFCWSDAYETRCPV